MPESPLCASALGCEERTEVEGWTLPARFGDPASEQRTLVERAGWVDLACMARLEVSGTDRVTFLQGMLSNDVRRLSPGEGCPVFQLSDQGKVVAEALLLVAESAVYLDTVAGAQAPMQAALERYIVADDVELVSGEDHVIGVFGPCAADALAAHAGTNLPGEPYRHVRRSVLGVDVHIVRVAEPGAGGFLCHVPRRQVTAWWDQVIAGGGAVGFGAFDALRIESGVPWYGRDITSDTIALEAPFASRISFAKGCYIGQEIVERVSARGKVNRHLVRLTLEEGSVPDPGAIVTVDGREIGHVTSAAWSWVSARPIALAYVRREHCAAGTTVTVGESATATVAACE